MGTTREELVLATLDSICRRADEVVFALYPDVSELKVIQSENGKAQVHYVTKIKDGCFRDEVVHTTLARICQEVEEAMFSWHSGLRADVPRISGPAEASLIQSGCSDGKALADEGLARGDTELMAHAGQHRVRPICA